MSSRKKRGVVSVNAVVSVTNGLGGAETSAIVQGKWTFPDNSTLTRTQYSDRNGNATFSTAAVGDGVYMFEIYSVTKSGFAWDKAGSETVDSFSLGDVAVNQPPAAAFSEICTQLGCSFDGSGSSDPDGSVVSWSWSFGDGGSGSGVNAAHDYGSAGNYTVTLTVTDNQGASDSSSHSVTVNDTPNPPVSVHVGDLDGNATAAARNRWVASVSIQLHKANDDPAAGVTVSGNWSNGANGSDSCVTAEDGRCTISKANLKSNVSSVMFTVNDAVKANTSYDSAANHDPEADSNGTSIMINR
jgi:PKD repeat protein